MKKIVFPLFIFAFVSTQAQTADVVIKKYASAAGGLDSFNKVQTLTMTGTVSIEEMKLPVTVTIINGKAMRSDVNLMGQFVINSYISGKGWKVNPLAGITTPVVVTGSELNNLKVQCMLANQLMDYKSRGHKIELKGQEDVKGVKAFKIKLTNKADGKVTTYYIGVADYMMIKSVTNLNIEGEQHVVETWYSDIKEINGLKFAMTRTQKVGEDVLQELKFNKIGMNEPVSEKIFDKQ